MMPPHDILDRLRRNVERVRERIGAACKRAGRDIGDVTLIGVTKYVDSVIMDALVEAGVADIGENRLQVAEPKLAAMSSRPKRHFIGPLQTNKVKRVLELFDEIHSLDRVELAHAIDRRAQDIGLAVVPCFIEVNVSGEASKAGFSRSQVLPALREISANCAHVRVIGLMTMAPLSDDAQSARPVFCALRELRDELSAGEYAQPTLTGLSMGMSGDFEIAIEEGATHVRVGTALFDGLLKNSGHA